MATSLIVAQCLGNVSYEKHKHFTNWGSTPFLNPKRFIKTVGQDAMCGYMKPEARTQPPQSRICV